MMSEENRLYNQNNKAWEYAEDPGQEAELLAHKKRVRSILNQLMEISADPCYDQYLAQMIRDLDSGRATPVQVEREAQRSFHQYKQRMAHQAMAQAHARHRQEADAGRTFLQTAGTGAGSGDKVEFKVGVHVFSLVGAVFILTAFVIFGFYFLSGLAQGLCLYGVTLILVLLSELLLSKKIPAFSCVLTGIGVGGLYAANMINYLVLHTINGVVALAAMLLIALGAFFISRKKDSAAIRIISLLGCYISFLPIRGFGSEFYFLIAAMVLFAVNTFSIFIRNQKNQTMADSIHILLNVIFTVILLGIAWSEGLKPAYLTVFVMTSFIFGSILCLQRSTEKENSLFIFGWIGNGIYVFLLFLIGTLSPGVSEPEAALFVHLLVEILLAAVCSVFFLLWKKEDGRRWAQIYYVAGILLLFGVSAEYYLERAAAVLFVVLLTRLLAGQKEIQVLDCITVMWAGLSGLWISDDWYCWLLVAALLLSVFGIKSMHIYHEIVITVSILAVWLSQCAFYLHREFKLDRGWICPVSAGILLLLFFMFNHLPWLKNKKQKPYNITNVILMIPYYLGVWLCDNYIFSSMMLVLGAVTILVVFRKRYEMELHRKYLLLTGFLVYFSLTGHYESPVIVSILLMIIALGCVGIGFKLHDRAERICGLVFALLACMKLAMYDFKEVEMIYRVIVFLAVGIIALIISFVYIQLEKNTKRREVQEQEVQEHGI